MKRRILPLLVACALLLAFSACAGKNAGSTPMTDYASAEMAPASEEMAMVSNEYAASDVAFDSGEGSAALAAPADKPADAGVRKIVYDADMRLTADDPSAALDTLSARAEALGGYVADASVNTDDDGVSYCTAVLKAPVDRFDELISSAKAAGKVTSYSLSSNDISQQYYDIAARLANAKAEETQLNAILSECRTVEDMLKVRESLAEVRADIESYQGQINLWDNLVSYATLTVSITRTARAVVAEDKTLVELWKASDVWKQITFGFQNSARILVNVLSGVGIFLACAILPAGLLFLCIGLPIILHHRKKKRKKAAAEAAITAAAEAPVIDTECAPVPEPPKKDGTR